MLSVQELAVLLSHKWVRSVRQAQRVAPSLRNDFMPGYMNAILDLGRRYGIYWTSERSFEIDPPTKASAMIERTSIAEIIAELREELRRAEQTDKKRIEEHQAPGYFRGSQQALRDIARELGFGDRERSRSA